MFAHDCARQMRNESLPQWILANVVPFLRLAFVIPQPVVPAARLKLPVRQAVLPAELRLPVGNPSLDGEGQIARRAEAVQVIPDEHGIAHQPRRGFEPGLLRELVCCDLRQPGDSRPSGLWPTFAGPLLEPAYGCGLAVEFESVKESDNVRFRCLEEPSIPALTRLLDR